MKILGVLIVLFLVSCNSGKQPQSCKEVCSGKGSDSEWSASVGIKGDIRCFDLEIKAIIEGQKKGYCAVPPPLNQLKFVEKYDPKWGWTYGTEDVPDPNTVLCQALKDRAKKKCDQLPPDPSQMNQPISGTSLYKEGKLFMQNGELVDKCDCTKERSGKPSTGKTTTEKASPTLPSQ